MSTNRRFSQVELGQYGPTSLGIREDNIQDDGAQQDSMPLLGVPLTGNLLFNTSWIVGLGIPKAVHAYHGQSLISPTLDWVGGIIFGLLALWLGEIGSKRPELCPRFFEDDLAPCILKFLRSRDVLLWLLIAPMGLSFIEIFPLYIHADRQFTKYGISEFVAQISKSDATQVILGFSLVVVFCLLSLKDLVWPKCFKGSGFQASFIVLAMILAHLWFLIIRSFRMNPSDPIPVQVTVAFTLSLHLLTMACASGRLHVLKQRPREGPFSSFLRHIHRLFFAMWIVALILLEVEIKYTWEKLPEFPETLFLSVYLWTVIHIYIRFSVMPPSWFTSAWKAAYVSVSGAGRRATAYVLDIYRGSVSEGEGRGSFRALDVENG